MDEQQFKTLITKHLIA